MLKMLSDEHHGSGDGDGAADESSECFHGVILEWE